MTYAVPCLLTLIYDAEFVHTKEQLLSARTDAAKLKSHTLTNNSRLSHAQL